MAHRTLRITNSGTETFSDRYDGQRFTVEPGSDLFVPWEAACLWFGDPTTVDLGPGAKHRTGERNRLMLRMGLGDSTGEELEERRPKIDCFNPENGTPVPMLMHDPEGPPSNPFGEKGEETDQQRLARAERFMEVIADAAGASSIDELLSKLGVSRKAESPVTAAEPPVDAPERPKAGSRR